VRDALTPEVAFWARIIGESFAASTPRGPAPRQIHVMGWYTSVEGIASARDRRAESFARQLPSWGPLSPRAIVIHAFFFFFTVNSVSL
jgi:hypothetical protein